MHSHRGLVHKLVALVTLVAGFAAASTSFPAPAHAAVPGQGYAWVVHDQKGVNHTYTSTGGAVLVTDQGNGIWLTRITNIRATRAGIAMVNPGTGTAGATCVVLGVNAITISPNPEVQVGVRCANAAGALLANPAFTVSYTSATGPTEGWLVSDTAWTSGALNHFNWTGKAVNESPAGTGVYAASYSGFGNPVGVAMTAALGLSNPGDHCTTLNTYQWTNPAQENAPVVCFASNGALVSSRIAQHYVYNRGLFADMVLKQGYAQVNGSSLTTAMKTIAAPYAYNSAGAATHAVRLAKGLYVVQFDKIAGSNRMAHVSPLAWGGADVRCAADVAAPNGNGSAIVACTNTTGAPVDAAFDVAYSARP